MKKPVSFLMALAILLSIVPLSGFAAEPQINWHTQPKYNYAYIAPTSENYQDVWWVTGNDDYNDADGLIRTDGTVLLEPKHSIYNFDYLYRWAGNGAYILDENGKDTKLDEDFGLGGGAYPANIYSLADQKLYYAWDYYSPDDSDAIEAYLDTTVTFATNEVYPALVLDKVTLGQDDMCTGTILGIGVVANNTLTTGTQYYESVAIAYEDGINPQNAVIIAENAAGKMGYIKADNTVLYPFVFDDATSFATVHNVAAVKQNGLWGFVNFPGQASAPTFPAAPNASKVLVDGVEISFDAYTINQNNYFKLRDIAQVIKGSDKQFEVSWDGTKNAINLISGKAYTPTGVELKAGDGMAKTAIQSTSAIYKDGKTVDLTAYTINENNYFKLRDLGKTFNFDVSWDGANNTIVINTKKPYTAE